MFRNMRYQRKKQLKLLHAGCHCLTFVLTVIALVAVFDSHNLAVPPIPNLYTLHSWIGLTSVILFCCQVIFNLQAKGALITYSLFSVSVCRWICDIPRSRRQASHQGCINASSQIFWHARACARHSSCFDGTPGKSYLDSVSKASYNYLTQNPNTFISFVSLLTHTNFSWFLLQIFCLHIIIFLTPA